MKSYQKFDDNIFHGYLPNRKTLEELFDLEVTVVWNLMAECSNVYLMEQEIFPYVVNTEIEDYSVPGMEEFLIDLERVYGYWKDGRKIFIHCCGGHGRTGMGLAGLFWRQGFGVEEALERSLGACKGPEMEEQVEFIRKLGEIERGGRG